MGDRRVREGSFLIDIQDLSTRIPQLDLTSPRHRLGRGQASNVTGLDVVTPNVHRPERGRKPVGVFIPEADRPVSYVGTLNAAAFVPLRYSFVRRTYREIQLVRTGSYDPSDGTLTDSDPNDAFASYAFKSRDRVLLHTPTGLKGYHEVFSRTSDTVIVLAKGLLPATTNIVYTLLQGKCVAYIPTDPFGDDTTWNRAFLKSPDLYDAEGGWDSGLVDGFTNVRPDGRGQDADDPIIGGSGERMKVLRVDTYAQENDTLIILTPAVDEDVTNKVVITGAQQVSLRGVLVTNGRKFWLLRSGQYDLMMDLGSNDYLGTTWKSAWIASNRFLLVSPKFAPRVLHLTKEVLSLGETDGQEIIAGMLPPSKPPNIEDVSLTENRVNPELERVIAPSWLGLLKAGEGNLVSGSDYYVLVRAVNVFDRIASHFVQVVKQLASPVISPTDYDSPGTWSTSLIPSSTVTFAGVNTGGIAIHEALNNSQRANKEYPYFPPIMHDRMTHIEVWRSGPDALTYYLESIIDIVDFEEGNELVNRNLDYPSIQYFAWVAAYNLSLSGLKIGITTWPVTMSAETLAALLPLTDVERISGGLPPMCRDVVSLDGVTLCFGRADALRTNPTFYAKSFFIRGAEYLERGDGDFELWAPNLFERYAFQDGDQIVITFGGMAGSNNDNLDEGTSVPLGVYDVVSRTDDHTIVCEGAPLSHAVYPTNDVHLRVVTVTDEANSILTKKTGAPVFVSSLVGKTIVFLGTDKSKERSVAVTAVIQEFIDVTQVRLTGNYNALVDYEEYFQVYDADLTMSNENREQGVSFHLRRPITWRWTHIESDEDVWFSRMDLFAPESFPPRVLQLSKMGDTFRKAVNIGNYVAVIMDQGVHLLFKGLDVFQRVVLLKDTIADVGEGTPWKDSVIKVSNRILLWATASGINAMAVSTEPDDTGNRARITALDERRFKGWFQEAKDNGYVIDAGFDSEHNIVRFRRNEGGHSYQTLQGNLSTGLWTLLLHDNGVRYVSSSILESTELSVPRLYSVEGLTGAVFEVNTSQSSDPYSSILLSGTLEDMTVSSTSIRSSNPVFSTLLTGETIHFTSDKPGVSGAVRTILNATSTTLTFTSLPELNADDGFRIAPIPLKIRHAPFQGISPAGVKTLDRIGTRFVPGDRGSVDTVTLRCFQNLKDEAVSSGPVDVFDSDAAGKTSRDRVLSLDGQGYALELELDVPDARGDLSIELLEFGVRVEVDETLDVET